MKSAARITIRAIRRRTWRLLSFVYPRSLSIHRRRCFSHRSTYLRRNKSDIPLQRDTSTRPAKTSARFSEQNLDPCLNGDFAYVILTIGRKFTEGRCATVLSWTRLDCGWTGRDPMMCRLFLRSLRRTSLRSRSLSENGRDGTYSASTWLAQSSDAITIRVDRIPLSLTSSVQLLILPSARSRYRISTTCMRG